MMCSGSMMKKWLQICGDKSLTFYHEDLVIVIVHNRQDFVIAMKDWGGCSGEDEGAVQLDLKWGPLKDQDLAMVVF